MALDRRTLAGGTCPRPVPSLFRPTVIDVTKQREPTSSEVPAQEDRRRCPGQGPKFELYSCGRSRALDAQVPASAAANGSSDIDRG
jgi:hypothetical protein